MTNMRWYRRGVTDGVPIALGYLAVSFALGITARNAGFSAVQAMVASITNNASAGEYAAMALIASGAGYLEVAAMSLVANARYFLMSCTLSQKFSPDTPFYHRLLIGYDLTDEIFGVAVASPGWIQPAYLYGVISIAIPGWALGTLLGVLFGNILPARLVSALGVGLFGMFMAIIIPPAKRNPVIAWLIGISFAASFAVSRIALPDHAAPGVKTIILTVFISAAAAVICPIKEEDHPNEG